MWRPTMFNPRQRFEWQQSTFLLCTTMFVQQHWHCVRPNFPIFNEITRHTMILPNDNALRVHFSFAEKMTTSMKPDGACYLVNDTVQVRQQKKNNDDEIQFMLVLCTPPSMTSAVEDEDGGRQNENMNDIMQKCKTYGWYCNFVQRLRML